MRQLVATMTANGRPSRRHEHLPASPVLPTPKPGDVLEIGGAASVQFAGDRGFRFRVIKVCPRPSYWGWLWLTGYVLDNKGQAKERREIFVQREGLQ
ncbi:hypothetical protein [Micromonospora sp. WMMD1082]|uniref:hypothetical protein n=1 Tax=Micromonospora sp. WMMD1082 TaxID=3016104 RepID=UPI002416EB40|nr:hypothetical protein [Micromonospora sp. WMMD1082]MDG4795997.1 hypothetical protein [Micromonospora sp. WMMD1082]